MAWLTAVLPTPKLAAVMLPACTGPLKLTRAVKYTAPVLLFDAVTPVGGHGFVEVNLMVGAGCVATFVVALQPQPVIGVAAGVAAVVAVI